MIFWGSQGVKLGWKQQPYKIRVRPCEALIQLYHISSKYKGNLEHMNIHHTWGNWANIMQVYLCRYLSSLSYVRVYGQCIYSPLPLAVSRWLFDATNWHFLIIAHQQPQHFCWESNFFPRASVVFASRCHQRAEHSPRVSASAAAAASVWPRAAMCLLCSHRDRWHFKNSHLWYER